MPSIPIFFDDWLKERYSESYITTIYRYLRKVERDIGDLDAITVEDIREAYWLRYNTTRKKYVQSFKRYLDYKKDYRYYREILTAFWGLKERDG